MLRADDPALMAPTRQLISSLALVNLSSELLDAAGRLDSRPLRSLDAIHLAAALSLDAELGVFIAYDHRLLDAAQAVGLPTLAPR